MAKVSPPPNERLCANCGSDDIWYDPIDGWCCGDCHACDSDE